LIAGVNIFPRVWLLAANDAHQPRKSGGIAIVSPVINGWFLRILG
jgi:hypothetical protein